MSRADEILAAAHAAAKVAELEDELAAAKGDETVTQELKSELRYARWLQRGGHLADPDDDNRADKIHRERFEQEA